ncbi:GtrA family protein [Pseudomonas sp. 6D_7.1_Bac1]|uniref:GtrA family protein n=1 Tax=Pseudomonas sp. 6D_7.1_Bac1 TaxID=2971615 RepID=UPI0021C92485|nr:GtrA family protein [Pseudomonas sp. 6D_7.1_Bac1]MCU1750415.1 GtrA family protein [Pseudomonas sp. 6D_7.1_Bac1]
MNSLTARLTKRIPAVQLLKYAFVGLLSNACGYALYLLLTELGSTPKLTMTALYMAGALVGFFGNRRLTFSYQGGILGSGIRYILAHTVGYGINFCLLAVFVDHFGYAHQWVQAVAIFVVAGYLFVTLKLFVFKATQ